MIDRDRSLRIRRGYTKRLPALPFANSTLWAWRRRFVFHKMKTMISSLSHAIVFRLFNFKKCTSSLSSQNFVSFSTFLTRVTRRRWLLLHVFDESVVCLVGLRTFPIKLSSISRHVPNSSTFEGNVFASELTISQDFVRHCPKLRAYGPIRHLAAMFQYLLAILEDEASHKVRNFVYEPWVSLKCPDVLKSEQYFRVFEKVGDFGVETVTQRVGAFVTSWDCEKHLSNGRSD